MRRKSMILMFLLLSVMAGCSNDADQFVLEETSQEPALEEREENESIFVFVCGAVKCEGVYELPAKSRVFEAVEMAGGFSEEAAVSHVNQAEVLKDEMRLYIPTMNEITEEQPQEDGKVNLNTATEEELMTLPGVGKSKAALIIQYREKQGRFQAIEDIMNISGIKEGLFGKIKDSIKV